MQSLKRLSEKLEGERPKFRIGLCGSSGSGKTTTAKEIEKYLGVPYVECSTKPLWKDFGVNSHQEIIERTVKDPDWGYEFQTEVIEARMKALKGMDSYVTDRTPIDAWGYFLMQLSAILGEDKCLDYTNRCITDLKSFDIIFHMEMLKTIEDDGKRIPNKVYQSFTDGVFKQIARSINTTPTRTPPILRIKDTTLTNRLELIFNSLEVI